MSSDRLRIYLNLSLATESRAPTTATTTPAAVTARATLPAGKKKPGIIIVNGVIIGCVVFRVIMSNIENTGSVDIKKQSRDLNAELGALGKRPSVGARTFCVAATLGTLTLVPVRGCALMLGGSASTDGCALSLSRGFRSTLFLMLIPARLSTSRRPPRVAFCRGCCFLQEHESHKYELRFATCTESTPGV